jgi:hypothetical protein
MTPTYEQKSKELLNDFTTSDWLKDAIRKVHDRDILDSLNDIEVLQDLLILRWHDAVKAKSNDDFNKAIGWAVKP